MFNFSANRLFLLSRTEYHSCAVFLMQDRDTQSVHHLYGVNTAQLIPPDKQRAAGNANSADEPHLVIESVRPDTKHLRDSNAPTLADGAGGSPID